MCIVCGPGGTQFLRTIAERYGPSKAAARSRFVAEEIAPALTPLLNPADLEELNGPADVILHGGPILTMRGRDEVAPAIAVRAGRIQAVGGEEPVLAHRGRLTRMIDLDGRALLPGFVVADWHPPLSLLCDWLEADTTPAVAQAAAIAERSDEWLALMVDGSAEDEAKAARLVAIAPRPAVAVHRSGSVLAASAAAQALAPELDPARFDEILPEARPHVSVILPSLLERLAGSRDSLRARLGVLFGEAARCGVTTLRFCGLGALTGHGDPDLVRGAAGGSPPLRLRGSLNASLALSSSSSRLWPNFGDDMFRIDTATDWIDAPGTDPLELAETVRALRQQGWRVTLHAGSPAAIDLALDAFSAAARLGASFDVSDGIERHAALAPGTWSRIGQLGISAGLILDDPAVTGDGGLDLDAPPDVPVSVTRDLMAGAPSPLAIIASPANPAGSTGVADRLSMVTADAAARCGARAILGSLGVGKYADFAFLDRDPRGVHLQGATQIECIGTWIAGREIRL
jgi:predicted amidohydrolase YtcJ